MVPKPEASGFASSDSRKNRESGSNPMFGRKLYTESVTLVCSVPTDLQTSKAATRRGGADGHAGLLAARIERLALEELAAVRKRDWKEARSKALERSRLQETYHRLNVWRLA